MPRYTVVANVFDKDGNETTNKHIPIDAPDAQTAHERAVDQLANKYEHVYVKEVRAPENNPVKTLQAVLRSDPEWTRPETMQALAKYFRATSQGWLCTPAELRNA